jgi:hypothetical protein
VLYSPENPIPLDAAAPQFISEALVTERLPYFARMPSNLARRVEYALDARKKIIQIAVQNSFFRSCHFRIYS